MIDVDPPEGERSLERLTDAGYELPQTLAVRTGSGGLHLYYYATPGSPLGNSAGRLPGIELELPGVDLRGDGGYVVAPPSVHVSGSRYAWIAHEAEPAPAPEWLSAEHTSPSEPIVIDIQTQGATSAYGRAALEGELEELGRAPVGTRNYTLNRCAFRLGRLVAGGELEEAEAVAALRGRATDRGLSAREVERTIASGLAAGLRNPRRRPSS